ncbi:hypothetical protein DFH08DRAFT_968372 [Mycena albidolilacea]|uniref:Uncharacterized protein n=1 Tax=Mycena albidolilacea TaxID=1033008 RepID=A0AAD7EJI1_9AGAR|nr:hypothetical protein DFH08DRAFT_968372 [Mycena albidolilacea]
MRKKPLDASFSHPVWYQILLSISRTPLPEPPPLPLALPFASVQSITQADIDRYVAPLYERNWLIFTEMPNMILTDDTLERTARTVSLLGKKFWFLRGRSATNFLADVVDLARQEKHEPRITMFLGRAKQHVLLRMHTSRTLSETERFSEEHVRPGLSTRDLRLAILLENHYQDQYVASRQALPLRDLLLRPDVPDFDAIRIKQDAKVFRAANVVKADAKWTPSSLTITALPPLPEDENAETICTNAHFDAFLRPLYARGWHAAFLPIMGEDKLYAPVLCLTGFFRFTSLTAAIDFIRDIVAYPWYKEDNAELHFLVDAQTVRAQLVYPPGYGALTVGNLRAARRIEQIFHDEYFGSARMSGVHPYRNDGLHQPGSVEELRRIRDIPLRPFHVRHNAKMARMRR